MKKVKTCLFTALLSLSFLGLVSCGEGTSNDSSIVNNDISLSQNSADMILGDTLELTASSSTKETIAWTSSDTSVAIVNDGTVLAIGKGVATITASIGENKATCLVNVGYGNYLPSLSLDNVASDSIALGKGTAFPLRGLASFNGKSYPCQLSISVEDKEIVSLSGNSLIGKKVGTTKVIVKGLWNNFSTPLMNKTIDVVVSNDISIYPEVTLANTKGVMNSIDLSLLSSWQGENYDSTANVKFIVKENGISKSASISSTDPEIISVTSDGFVQAKKVGEAKLVGTYVDENGNEYYSYVDVKVTCPVATYDGQLKVASSSPFPLDEYFGEGALLTYAKQGEKELKFLSNGYIEGLTAEGEDSEPLLIMTNKGGFYFEDSFIYTKALNNENFLSTLKLESGKVIDGYYILDSDITSEIDMTSQESSYYSASDTYKNKYFKGTFDGLGHTLKAKVAREGIFGGLGEKAVIKNTHFEFTFSSSDFCSGIARNNWTNNIKGWKATLSNLYVTTTNYYDHSYSLFEYRFNDLAMNDIYVNLTLSEGVGEVTSSTQEKGALFHTDSTISSGPFGSFTGDFRNVYVVSDKFMPISSGYSVNNLFVTYAKNDMDKLGDYERAGKTDSINSCVLGSKDNNAKKVLFGSLPTVTWYFPTTKNTNLVFVYLSLSSIGNGGIYRYDTTTELKNSGIGKVGSWDVL
ncbi:MAG TPA: hypothetical protein DD377_00345 [Firmicutes bacterium]|nr:hypothetical protein [Bacillota bacterium]HBM69862.1 hypothetical protein [Bacillota bacterium]